MRNREESGYCVRETFPRPSGRQGRLRKPMESTRGLFWSGSKRVGSDSIETPQKDAEGRGNLPQEGILNFPGEAAIGGGCPEYLSYGATNESEANHLLCDVSGSPRRCCISHPHGHRQSSARQETGTSDEWQKLCGHFIGVGV